MEVGRGVDVKKKLMLVLKNGFNWHWLESKDNEGYLFLCACMNVCSCGKKIPALEERATVIPVFKILFFSTCLARSIPRFGTVDTFHFRSLQSA